MRSRGSIGWGPVRGDRYEPALDGLRGLAVAGVFLFHCGAPWMPGGFLGVSTFFTLSGFLITRLLLEDQDAHGRLRLGRFWERRVRRLVPAQTVAVALVLALAPWLADAGQRRALAGDTLATLLYAANWHFALAGRSYADLFHDPSLLLHCWSLGVEGQFYLVFPLLALGALGLGGRRGLGVLLGAATLASVAAAPWLARGAGGADRVYYGTDTRAAELLVGGALALLLHGRPRAAHGRGAWLAGLAGTLALAAQVATWTATTMESAWLTRGGLAAYACLSALIVLGAVAGRGPVRALLALGGLRRLGEISYGVYLYHWPVVLWLTPARMPLPPLAVDVLRAVVTLVAAEVSWRVLELPVRARRRLLGRALWGAAAGATAALALAAVLVPAPPPDALFAELEAAAHEEATLARPRREPAVGEVPYAFFGDSTAFGSARAFGTWAEGRTAGRRFVRVPGRVRLGCGIMGAARRRLPTGRDVACPDVAREWAAIVRATGARLAIVQTGAWETHPHRLRRGDGYRVLGDPEFDAHLADSMSRVVHALSGAGAVVVWVLAPRPGPPPDPATGVPAEAREHLDPARTDRHNEIITRLAAAHPEEMALVDLPAQYAAVFPAGEDDVEARPDGVHLSAPAAVRLADRLGPAVVAACDAVLARRRARPGGGAELVPGPSPGRGRSADVRGLGEVP